MCLAFAAVGAGVAYLILLFFSTLGFVILCFYSATNLTLWLTLRFWLLAIGFLQSWVLFIMVRNDIITDSQGWLALSSLCCVIFCFGIFLRMGLKQERKSMSR